MWIAGKLLRSERWVQSTWGKYAEQCFTEFSENWPMISTQESQKIF